MLQMSERPALMRHALGESLREARAAGGLTLREVSARAQVSLGYLSELERGRKEASSELLNSICAALGVSLPSLLRQVAERIDRERVVVAAHGASVTRLRVPERRGVAA